MAFCPHCGLLLAFIPELNRRVCVNPRCPLALAHGHPKADKADTGRGR